MRIVTCMHRGQGKMVVRLAANLSFLFKEKEFLERFAAAASCGFKAVEFGAEVPDKWSKEEILAAKEAAGVEVVTLCASKGGSGDRGLAAVPGREADFKASLATAIDYAKALNCPKVHSLAGAFPEASPSDPVWEKAKTTYIANLRYAAEECAKSGITLIIEPISTIPGYFLQHQQQAADIVREVGSSNLKIEFDVFHAQTLDGNLCDFLTNNLPIIGHIQLGQVPGRHEPDEQGEVNFPFLFQTLESLGYEGWLGCEYIPRGRTEDGLEWAAHYLKGQK